MQAVSETDTARVLSAVSQLSLWFKAHMPDVLIATPQGPLGPVLALAFLLMSATVCNPQAGSC